MTEHITHYASPCNREITRRGMGSEYAWRNKRCVYGNRLKTIRTSRKLTQATVAERMGVSEAQISRWEAGKDNFPSSRVPDLAAAYGCAMGDIFDEPKPKPEPVQVPIVPTVEQLVPLLEALIPLLPDGDPTDLALQVVAEALAYGLGLLRDQTSTLSSEDALRVASNAAVSRFSERSLQ